MDESDLRALDGRLKLFPSVNISSKEISTVNDSGLIILTGTVSHMDAGAFACFAVSEDPVVDILERCDGNLFDNGCGDDRQYQEDKSDQE